MLFRRFSKRCSDKKGFTLMEVVIVIAIIGIISTIVTVNVGRLAKESYMRRADDTAQVVYMGLQTAMSDLKVRGEFDEVFNEDALAAGTYKVPEHAITGGTADSIAYPGVTNPDGTDMDREEQQELIDSGNIVYLPLSIDGTLNDSELIQDVLKNYIADKSIFEYTVIAEINLSNKTVRSVFYSERADEFEYGDTLAGITDEELKSRENILMREPGELDDKWQGYYGISSVGEDEGVVDLENERVDIYNDDLLVVEWAEMLPDDIESNDYDALKEVTYDVSIVNAYDSSLVYYQIEDISLYDETAPTEVPTAGITELGTYGLPIYDLYEYNDAGENGVDRANDDSNKTSFPTKTFSTSPDLSDPGTIVDLGDTEHQIAYFKETGERAGTYRLVLDSMNGVDIRTNYPNIPWDADFRVVVEGKHDGVGFQGSLAVSDESSNAYLGNQRVELTDGVSGASLADGRSARGFHVLKDFAAAISDDTPPSQKAHYEFGYSRHLKNMNYIVQDVANDGDEQEFLLTKDIDWSVQEIGQIEYLSARGDLTAGHRVTVSNTKDNISVLETDTNDLETLVPIGQNADGTNVPFEGRITSGLMRDTNGNVVVLESGTPRHESYTINNLKIAGEVAADGVTSNVVTIESENYIGNNIGLFSNVGEAGTIENLTIAGVAALGTENVGAFAGEVSGRVENLTVVKNSTPNAHSSMTIDSTTGLYQLQTYNGTEFTPSEYADTTARIEFKGNTVQAVATGTEGGINAGGLFGIVRDEGPDNDEENRAQIENIANGTKFINRSDGLLNNDEKLTQNPTGGVATADSLNGIAVEASQVAGGIAGKLSKDVDLKQVVNTGSVTVIDGYAGGVAGIVEHNVDFIGYDEVNAPSAEGKIDEELELMTKQLEELKLPESELDMDDTDKLKELTSTVVRVYDHEYNNNPVQLVFAADAANYGDISAKYQAGGIYGAAVYPTDETYPDTARVTVTDVANEGSVSVSNSYAGGIIGIAEEGRLQLENVRNRAEVQALGAHSTVELENLSELEEAAGVGIAGGIVGVLGEKSIIAGATVQDTYSEHSVFGTSTEVGNADIFAKNNAGGIAGILTDDASIQLLNDEVDGADYVRSVVNTMNVKTEIDNAGGLVGYMTDNTVVNPTVDEVGETAMYATAFVDANNANAGGIVGKIDSKDVVLSNAFAQKDLSIDINTNDDEDTVTNLNPVVSAGNNAGGIVGNIDANNDGKIIQYTGKFVRDAIMDDVTANSIDVVARENNAGGIAGVSQEYLANLTNKGNITAKNNAGGIVGLIGVDEKEVGMFDKTETFIDHCVNTGLVKATNENSGGIAGYVEANTGIVLNSTNTGRIESENNSGGVVGQLEGNNQILTTAEDTEFFKADGLSNIGQVKAYGEASGGIVGLVNAELATDTVKAEEVLIQNLKNNSYVTADDKFAGGIAGKIQGSVTITNEDDVVERFIINNETNAAGFYKSKSHIGGIVGGASGETTLTDLYNVADVGEDIKNNPSSNYSGGILGGYYVNEEDGYNHATPIISADPNHVELMFEHGVYHNEGDIAASTHSGGILGGSDTLVTTDKFHHEVKDMYNSGEVSAVNIAGGLVGILRNGTVDNGETILLDVKDDEGNRIDTYSNVGTIKGSATNSSKFGGIVGEAVGKEGYTSVVTNVFNSGTVENAGYRLGGIVGSLQNSHLVYDTDTVEQLLEVDMRTNVGDIISTGSGAEHIGGIIGHAYLVDISGLEDGTTATVNDVYNAGAVTSTHSYGTSYMGGIIGYANGVTLTYSEQLFEASEKDLTQFIFANEGTVSGKINATTGALSPAGFYVGGLIGRAELSIIENGFNSGIEGYEEAIYGEAYAKVPQIYGLSRTGGLIGEAKTVEIKYSDGIEENIRTIEDYPSSNVANIKSVHHYAGGILGYGTDRVGLQNVYNGGTVSGSSYSIGGIVGELWQTTADNHLALEFEDPIKQNIDLENTDIVSINHKDMLTQTGGLDASYIAYDTVTEGRYSSEPKPSVEAFVEGPFISGRYNVGGIVGRALSTNRGDTTTLQIENAFSGGGEDGNLGVYASQSNAGGITGMADYADIIYTLDLNGAPAFADLTEESDKQTYYSTFNPVFNTAEVRSNPYVIPGTDEPLNLVPNSASVTVGPESKKKVTTEKLDDYEDTNISMATHNATVHHYSNAGGIVGYSVGGSIQRVYGVTGEVDTLTNVGGIVGFANQTLIKQVMRNEEADILLPTTYEVGATTGATLTQRGSGKVGGIVGQANKAEIYDVRNLVAVEGRSNVGGILGYDLGGTDITLAHNSNAVIGTAIEKTDFGIGIYDDVDVDKYAGVYDNTARAGSQIGGIVGHATTTTDITMAKTDTRISNNFSDLELEVAEDGTISDKWKKGGNTVTSPYPLADGSAESEQISMVSGVRDVGGITGYSGNVNYSINTGYVTGNERVGGISGQGYRITNVYNTGNVDGNNGWNYATIQPDAAYYNATSIGGVTGQLGSNPKIAYNAYSIVEEGSYIQNAYNASQIVEGSSHIGGIAGVAFAPIDTSYNQSIVSAFEGGNTGGFIGGIVGILGQDELKNGKSQMTISNSYNVGQIVGTSYTGGLVGTLELLSSIIETPKIINSYYLTDDKIQFYNQYENKIEHSINSKISGITIAEYTSEDSLAVFFDEIEPAPGATDDFGKLGERKYEQTINKFALDESPAAGIVATGDEHLVTPLNGELGSLSPITAIAPNSTKLVSTARVPFEYNAEDDIDALVDYRFPHLDFSRSGIDSAAIKIDGTFSSELDGYNQSFISINEVSISEHYEYWSTKTETYHPITVEYAEGDDIHNVEVSNYRADNYPVNRFSDETITFKTTLTDTDGDGNIDYPDYLTINVYDGHSRGEYTYDNETFINRIYPKYSAKSYYLVELETYKKETGLTDAVANVDLDPTSPDGAYVYYTRDGEVLPELSDRVQISGNITADGNEISYVLDSIEMQSYLAASSGYFTAEVVSTEAAESVDGTIGTTPPVDEDKKSTYTVSRMFNFHFSNNDINEEHNNDIVTKKIADGDTDFFDDLDNLYHKTEGTVALGSSSVNEAGEYVVRNELRIANERHFYNMNQGDSLGNASSNMILPYLNYSYILTNDLTLSGNIHKNEHNGFVVGQGLTEMFRFTGSLDGAGHTIDGLKVNRVTYPGTKVSGTVNSNLAGMPSADYGLFYDISGGVVKNLIIGENSEIIGGRVAGLAYHTSNGRTTLIPAGADKYTTVFDDKSNPFEENVAPALTGEIGTTAIISNVDVHADVTGSEVGGVVFNTARRYQSTEEFYEHQGSGFATAPGDLIPQVLRMTDVEYFGEAKASYGRDGVMDSLAAGIVAQSGGFVKTDDIHVSNNDQLLDLRAAAPALITLTDVRTNEEAMIESDYISSGILGVTLSNTGIGGSTQSQVIITDATNNAHVIAKKEATGIAHGIVIASFEEGFANLSNPGVYKASPTTAGSFTIKDTVNNGTVEIKDAIKHGMASGIAHQVTAISGVKNTGEIIGDYASGITSYGMAQLEMTNVINSGKVVGTYMAGGIVAAPAIVSPLVEDIDAAGDELPIGSPGFVWEENRVDIKNAFNTGMVVVKTNVDTNMAEHNSYAGGIIGYLPSSDTETNLVDMNGVDPMPDKSSVSSTYNIGEVRYEGGKAGSELQHANLGGIVGGGLNFETSIQNSYNLSDADLKSAEDKSPFNYNLPVVGTARYGANVTNFSYNDKINLTILGDNWAESTDANYPYPMFKEWNLSESQAPEVDDMPYTVEHNAEKGKSVNSTITYNDSSFEYAINIDGGFANNKSYEVRVYDGDALSTDYAAKVIQTYEINNGVITSGDRSFQTGPVSSVSTETVSNFDEKIKIESVVPGTRTGYHYDSEGEVDNIADTVRLSSNKLVITPKEAARWYMPNHGFYTVIVLDKSSEYSVSVDHISERFQAQFGGEEADGSTIKSATYDPEGNSKTLYPYAGGGDDYIVTNEYSILALTTSGVAENATTNRIYRQIEDITVNEDMYSIFKFDGSYIGDDMDGTKPLITRADGDAGFVFYLGSGASLTNFTLDVNAVEGEFKDPYKPGGLPVADSPMRNIGKYPEAAYYAGNAAIVADYAESNTTINGVTTTGDVELISAQLLNHMGNDPFLIGEREDKETKKTNVFAGIVAVALEGVTVNNTENNTNITTQITEKEYEVVVDPFEGFPGYQETFEYEVGSDTKLQIAGVAGLVDKGSKLVSVSNNGVLKGSEDKHAAGLAIELRCTSSIENSFNSGEIQVDSADASGLVYYVGEAATVKNSYNSGKIQASPETEADVEGFTSGLFGSVEPSATGVRFDNLYNSGELSSANRYAIANVNEAIQTELSGEAYYFEDEKLYWMDSTAIPGYEEELSAFDFDATGLPAHDAEVEEDEEKLPPIYKGFANRPLKSFAFGEEAATEEDYQFSYDMEEIPTNFTDAGTWKILTTDDGAHLTNDYSLGYGVDYGDDEYGLPQLVNNAHGTREEHNFPIFVGYPEAVNQAPYEEAGLGDGMPKYVTIEDDVNAQINTSEIFRDTISLDLQNANESDSYTIGIFKEDATLGEDAIELDGAVGDAVDTIQINQVYVEFKNLVAGSTESESLAKASDANNLQYTKPVYTEHGVFYYEIEETDDFDGLKALFLSKEPNASGRFEVAINNNLLDKLEALDGTAGEVYYSATIMEYVQPGSDETDVDSFYGKFSPHFANAVTDQASAWMYGSETNPYEIHTKRNLSHISDGEMVADIDTGEEAFVPNAHYIESNYKQTKDVILRDHKTVSTAIAEAEGVAESNFDLWSMQGIGTEENPFAGTYIADAGKSIKDRIDSNGDRYGLFDYAGSDARIENITYELPEVDFTVPTGVSALVVENSEAELNNLAIHVPKNNKKAIVNLEDKGTFGLLVGNMTGGTMNVDKVDALPTMTGHDVHLALNTAKNDAITGTVGGIIGSVVVDRDLEFNNLTSHVSIISNGTIYNSSVAGTFGGIIGSLTSNPSSSAIEKPEVTLNNVVSKGDLENFGLKLNVAESAHFGGTVGAVNDLSLAINGLNSSTTAYFNTLMATKDMNVGSVIGTLNDSDYNMNNLKDSSRLSVGHSSNVMNKDYNVALGGIIGRASDSTVVMTEGTNSVTGTSSVTNTFVMSSKDIPPSLQLGGLIGIAEDTELEIDNLSVNRALSASSRDLGFKNSNIGGLVGSIHANEDSNLNPSFKNVTVAGVINTSYLHEVASVGGVIGSVTKANTPGTSMNLTLENVAANTVETLKNTKSSSAYNGRYGGVLGSTSIDSIDMNNVKASGNLTLTSTSTIGEQSVGGVIGHISNEGTASYSLNGVMNTGAINIGTANNSSIGGVIGKVHNNGIMTQDLNHLENQGALNIGTSYETSIGALIGSIENEKDLKETATSMKNSGAITVQNAKSNTSIAGIIGEITVADGATTTTSFSLNNVAEGANVSNTGAITVSETSPVSGSDSTNVTIGGLFGIMNNESDTPNILGVTDKSLSNTGNITINNSKENAFVGGLFGKVKSFEIYYPSSVTNTGNIAITSIEKDPMPAGKDVVVGGIVGTAVNSDIAFKGQLTGELTTGTSTLGNSGNIDVTLVETADEATLKAAGGIGTVIDSMVYIDGFRNTGNINVSGKSNNTVVTIAGIIAEATDTLTTPNATPEKLLAVVNSLNAGTISTAGLEDTNIVEETPVEPSPEPGDDDGEDDSDDDGDDTDDSDDDDVIVRSSKDIAAGIVGRTDLQDGLSILYSQNAGVVEAANASGIIHEVMNVPAVVPSLADDRLFEVKYNINMAPINITSNEADDDSTDDDDSDDSSSPDAGDTGETPEDDTNSNVITKGYGITSTVELPVYATEDGVEYNGIPLILEADEEAPVPFRYFNISLESMARGQEEPKTEEESDGDDTDDSDDAVDSGDGDDSDDSTPEDRVHLDYFNDSLQIRLADLQSETRIEELSNWNATGENIIGDTGFWNMTDITEIEGMEAMGAIFLPTITGNEYVPTLTEDTSHYLSQAPEITNIEYDSFGNIEVEWEYFAGKDEDDAFAIVVSKDGMAKRVLEFQKADDLGSEDDTTFSYIIDQEQISDITNAFATDAEELQFSIAVIDGINNRHLRSSDTVKQVNKTDDVTPLTTDLILQVASQALSGRPFGLSGNPYGSPIVNYAMTRVGDPYSQALAGTGNYLDCSYLVMEANRQVGVNLPRTAAAQAQYIVENNLQITAEELMPGDLIFYSYANNGRYRNVSHVAIYAGNGMMVHAANSRKGTVYEEVNMSNIDLYGRTYATPAVVFNPELDSSANISEQEIYLLAQIIGLEAGGTGRDGMIAVGEVIRNRVYSSTFPNTIYDVVSAPRQFTTFKMIDNYTPTAEQITIAREVMSGASVLNNSNVLYFCSTEYYNSVYGNDTFWTGMDVVAEYGNTFFTP